MPTILCVEDEIQLRDIITEVLDEQGYDTHCANNGSEALQYLQVNTPDLILCDVNMPQMNGYDFLKAVRAQPLPLSQVPFIFLTALRDMQEVNYGLNLGAEDYLTKPINLDVLLTKIGTALESAPRTLAQPLDIDSSFLSDIEPTETYVPDSDDSKTGLKPRRELLLIDANPFTADMVLEAADEVGYVVHTVTTRADFETYKDREFDVYVMDVFFPGWDGIEIIRYLSERGRKAATILLSNDDGKVLPAAAELARERGLKVLGTLNLPFMPDSLVALLKRHRHMPVVHESAHSDIYPSINEIREAIENEQLHLAYQPKIGTITKMLHGVEALVRWHHPTKGMIPPGYFVPIAEANGLIDKLTDFVLDRAVEQCGVWRRRGLPIITSINMSPLSMTDLQLPDKLQDICETHGVRPEHVAIEMTETAVTNDQATYMDILTRLRMKGFNLSIDDFGTGFSTLQQLVKVPFNELKIDQTFVNCIDTNKDSRAIVKASIALAHELDMRVVAEGVETEAAWQFLREHDCDEIQGYYIGRPMSEAKLVDWLTEWDKRVVDVRAKEAWS